MKHTLTASAIACALGIAGIAGGWLFLRSHGAADPAASRTVVSYQAVVPEGAETDPSVRYAYAGEPVPGKIVPDEAVDKRTENSYTRDLGVENAGTKDEKHVYQAIIYMHPVFVLSGGKWYRRETATTTESAFYEAKPLRYLAKLFSTAVAYAASYSGFSTSADADISETVTMDAGDPDDWNLCIDGTAGQSSDSAATTILIRSQFSTAGNGSCNIHVAHLPFDTSTIPSGSSVSAATLSVYMTAKTNTTNDGNDTVNVAQSSASPDLFAIIAGGGGATALDITSMTTSAYNNFTLNATGRSWITPGGTSYFGLFEGHASAGFFVTGLDSITISSSENTGTSQDPTLAVTYTARSFSFWMFQDF